MSRDLEKVVAEALVAVREDCEKVLKVYDLIEAYNNVSEQVFIMTFTPRMVEIVKVWLGPASRNPYFCSASARKCCPD